MREIKFRAWDGKGMKTAFDLSQNPKYWWEENKDYPLMQYTGLKVNKDVELYEGDICNVEVCVYHGWKQGTDIFRANAKVIYDSSEMRYRFLACKDGSWHFVDFDKGIRQKYKIIGNVFENPELLAGDLNES